MQIRYVSRMRIGAALQVKAKDQLKSESIIKPLQRDHLEDSLALARSRRLDQEPGVLGSQTAQQPHRVRHRERTPILTPISLNQIKGPQSRKLIDRETW